MLQQLAMTAASAAIPEVCAGVKIDTAKVACSGKTPMHLFPWARQFLWTPLGIENMVKLELGNGIYRMFGRASTLLLNDYLRHLYEQQTGKSIKTAPLKVKLGAATMSATLISIGVSPIEVLKTGYADSCK